MIRNTEYFSENENFNIVDVLLLDHHIKEEEREMLPKMRKDLDKGLQNEMGFQFMKLRDFSIKDLEHYPKLQEKVPALKKMSDRVSVSFITKVQEHARA